MKLSLTEAVKPKQFEMLVDPHLEYDDTKINVIRQYIRFVIKEVGIEGAFRLVFTTEREKLGVKTTAYYRDKDKMVVVYAKNRMLGDVLRSVTHELVHKKQYEEGRIKHPVQDVGGEIEDEANAKAGAIIKLFIKDNPMGKFLFD
jgi:hypothetical protein